MGNFSKLHNPPEHLGQHGRVFFADVATEYGIDDSAGIALLTTAAECLDRMRAAQVAIAIHGEVTVDRYGGPKVNPACALEKDARNGFLAALRALNLDLEPLRDRPGRPAGS
ncbi:MAG: hypothetical protein RID42_17260 [Alphaproteobacteria bacterium]